MTFQRPEKVSVEFEVKESRGIYLSIPKKMFRPDPNQPRKDINQEDIDVKRHQLETMDQLSPLRVYELMVDPATGEQFYPLEDGECRWRAAMQSEAEHLTHLEAQIISRDDNKSDREQELEKLTRQLQSNEDGNIKMTLADKANAYERVKELAGTNRAAALMVGKGEDHFSRVLAFNKLPDDVKFAAKKFDIEDPKTLMMLRDIYKSSDESYSSVISDIDKVKETGVGSVREVASEANQKIKKPTKSKKEKKTRPIAIKDVEITKGEKNYILDVIKGRENLRFILTEEMREKLK